MQDYATKDDLNRFVQYLRSELRKADRPDLQWVLYGEGREWKNFAVNVALMAFAAAEMPAGEKSP